MGGKRRGGSLQSRPPPQAQIEQIVMASEQELAEAFKLFDSDGDGIITSEELRALIEKVGGTMTEGEAVALIHKADKDGDKQAEAERCVAELDVDKDGRVSYPEFLLVMKY